MFIETESAPADFFTLEVLSLSLSFCVTVHNRSANSFTSRSGFLEATALTAGSDEALMMRFCEGDETAFVELFTRHASQARVYLCRLTGIAFVSGVKARGRFTRGAMFRSWLYEIATHAARDLHRRRRQEDLVSQTGTDPSVEMKVRDRGLEKSVRSAVEQLPDAQRAAIVTHRFEGMSFVEIAAVEGTREEAVKVRSHRGYEKLRELLRDLWSGV